MSWNYGSIEAALRTAWKVSSVSSHQMSGFNLYQRAWGKVMIQMLSPSLNCSSAFHLGKRGREGWTDWEDTPGTPAQLTHAQVYILIYNKRACPAELWLICWWERGTAWDYQGRLRMFDRIYILTVALRWLSQAPRANPVYEIPYPSGEVLSSPFEDAISKCVKYDKSLFILCTSYGSDIKMIFLVLFPRRTLDSNVF